MRDFFKFGRDLTFNTLEGPYKSFITNSNALKPLVIEDFYINWFP